jgi:hypothetical protein
MSLAKPAHIIADSGYQASKLPKPFGPNTFIENILGGDIDLFCIIHYLCTSFYKSKPRLQ